MKLIGSGAEADVYLLENKAVKLFKNDRPLEWVHYEAELQSSAHKAGLPVPAIYEVAEIDGKAAIIMEYVKGEPLGEAMLQNMDNAAHYIEISVDLQMAVHKVSADGFPDRKEKLKHNIQNAPYLNDTQKHGLIQLLEALETGSSLCHGDFHVLNLLQTSDDIQIIDWICASGGSAASDVCRTYMLYALYRPGIAEQYVDMYCRKSGLIKQDVFAWLPVIAGARLSENATEADIALLLDMVNAH